MEEPNILIKTALAEAVQKVNEGVSPTDALLKVANELDLNPNYIQRTGEALNVALHYKHFKTASDRSTEFPIADIPSVIKQAFTTVEKTASEIASDSFSSTDMNDEVFNYTRILNNPLYKRAFMEIENATEQHDSFGTSFGTVYDKASHYITNLSKQAEEAEVQKVAAEIELNDKFAAISDELHKDAGYRASFDEFESQVFAKHGEASVPYLDLIYKTSSSTEDRGVHDSGYMMFKQCKLASMFDEFMAAAGNMIAAEQDAIEKQASLAEEKEYHQEIRTEIGKTASLKSNTQKVAEVVTEADKLAEEAESEDPVIQEIKKKANDAAYRVGEVYNHDPVIKEANEKLAFGMGGVGRSFGESLGGLFQQHVVDAVGSSFEPKEPKARKPNVTLDNMERKLLLQELMLTDPILSKINPTRVAKAYEQILRLSPEISKEKEVVRAELRAMVASQALSKYDADLMAKLDSGMLKRRIGTQEFYGGNTSNFRL